MKIKSKVVWFLVMLVLLGSFSTTPTAAIDHAEFEADEDKYKNMCLVNVELKNTDVCGEFQKYLNDKIAKQRKRIDEIAAQIDEINENIDEYSKKLTAYEMEIEQLDIDIKMLDESIEEMILNIEELETSIAEKQAETDRIDEIVKNRMQFSLSGYFVSDHIAFLFGAENFAQFIQRSEILNTISEHDKQQMDQLEALRDELNLEKEALEQQKVAVEANLENVKVAKESKEKLQKATKALIIRYREEEAKLVKASDEIAQEVKLTESEQTKVKNGINEAIRKEKERLAEEERKKQEQQNNSGSGTGNTGGDSPSNSTGGWAYPAASGFRVSAGAWQYPSSFSNNPHYGVDLAASVGHRVQSVQPGVVVQVQGGCPIYGYYGSRCNNKSGNNVQVVHSVDGKLYRTWYAHLATIDVQLGQYVERGQKIGTVGSSGSSTGPHLHFELHLIGHGTLANFSGNIPFITRSVGTRCESNGNTPPCYVKPDSWYGFVVGRSY